jgi:transposase
MAALRPAWRSRPIRSAIGLDDVGLLLCRGEGSSVPTTRVANVTARYRLRPTRACLPNLGVLGLNAGVMLRTSVLTDERWARIEPLLPSSDGRRGRPFRDHRQVIEGIVFRLRTGVPWRDLPAQFGPWQTVWKRHRRFATDGTWDKVLGQLQAQADAAGDIEWVVSVDSTIARVHQHGATASRLVSTAVVSTGGTTELQESA